MVTSTPPSGSVRRTGPAGAIRARAAAATTLLVAAGLGWWPGSRATAEPPPPPQGGPSPGGVAAPAPRPPLEVTGATRIEYDDAAKQWAFSGARVVVVRDTVRVEAPEITYRELAREVVLPRGGAVLTPTLEVSADWMAARLDTRHVTAEGHVAGRFAGEEESSSGPPHAGDNPRTRWGTFTAGRVEVDDRLGLRQVVATGQVSVEQGDRRLRGDRIVYNLGTQQGTAEGHAELARGSDVLRAERVLADLGRHDATADGDVQLDHGELHGLADHATYTEMTHTAVLWGHARLLRGRDTLTAEQVTVLLDRDAAIAEGHVRIVAYPGESSQ